MVAQVAAVVGLILGHEYGGWVKQTATVLLWVVVVVALMSMVQYFREFWSKLDINIKNREHKRLKILERRRQRIAERRELRRLRREERMREDRQAEPEHPTP
jgi:hypothetical protein